MTEKAGLDTLTTRTGNSSTAETPALADNPIARIRDQLIRNTVYGAGGRVFGIAVALVLTPYLLARLGAERYALYALASVVTGYLSLLDLGLGTGYVKYVAEAHASRDSRAMNEALATGFYAYLGFGGALMAAWFFARDPFVRLLNLDPAVRQEAGTVFTVAVLILSLSGAAAAFRAVLHGMQRIDVATRIGVALILPRLVAVVAVLESGQGVVGLVCADLALFLCGTAAMAWSARGLFPALSLRPRHATAKCVRKLLRYGVRLQVSRGSELVNFHFDKLVLARYVGLAAVTDYELGSRILTTARSLPLMLLNAMVPAVSELDARGEGRAIARLSARTLRYLLVSGVGIFGVLVTVAPRLMAAWLGDGHEASARVVRVLALGYLLNVASGAFTSVCQGIDRTDYQMKVALLALLTNVVLSLALVRELGLDGVLVATTLSLVLAFLYAAKRFPSILPAVTPGDHAGIYTRSALAAAAGLALGAAVERSCLALGRGGRGGEVMVGAVLAAAFIVAYTAVAWRIRLVDGDDLAALRGRPG